MDSSSDLVPQDLTLSLADQHAKMAKGSQTPDTETVPKDARQIHGNEENISYNPNVDPDRERSPRQALGTGEPPDKAGSASR